jgi:mevalonate kinase
VEFSGWEGDGISLHSDFGIGIISGQGKYEGPVELEIYQAVANRIFGDGKVPSCKAEFIPAWKLKGVGASASFCAAFAAGLFHLTGKKPTVEEIFAAAQSGDLVAHAGKASGIDAKTVSFGHPLVFQRSFSPPAFNSQPADFALPSGRVLLLVDTFAGRKDGTGKMIEIFAKSFGITGVPQEIGEEKRAQVREEYVPVWEKIRLAMKGASAAELGKIMNENHALLSARGVSSSGIEKAVSASLSSGALGAKLTGAGGEGGAALVLCEKKNIAEVMKKISDAAGFSSYPLSLANRGACVD